MDKTAKQAIDRYLKWIVESIQDQHSNKFDELWYNDSCIEFSSYTAGNIMAKKSDSLYYLNNEKNTNNPN